MGIIKVIDISVPIITINNKNVKHTKNSLFCIFIIGLLQIGNFFYWLLLTKMLNFLRFNPPNSEHSVSINDITIHYEPKRMQKEQNTNAYAKLFNLFQNIHDYTTLYTRQNILLLYIFLLLIYISMNFALLGLNFQSQNFIETNYYLPFHLLSFWGVFFFTLLEAFILISADIVSSSNILQSGLVLFNIFTTLATAIIFSMYPKFYEVTAHYLEYSAQVLISTVNILFAVNFMRQREGSFQKILCLNRIRWIELIISIPIVWLSCLQLLIYSTFLPVSIEPERAAHFCEFTNEIINAVFALTYSISIYYDIGIKMREEYQKMYHFE